MAYERLFLCGGNTKSKAIKYPPETKSMPLLLWGRSCNIILKISDLTRKMVSNLSDLYADLLEIATYVYYIYTKELAADSLCHFVKFQIIFEVARPQEVSEPHCMKGKDKMANNTHSQSPGVQLLTAKAVGEKLSLSKRQIFRLNSCGKIPASIRIGGSVRWAKSVITEWLAAGAPDRKTFEAMQEVANRGE